ncbi:MAG: PrsW family intramembrane metalloprotease, partial [Prevotella sp.]|nr:PrsW family intramembrane metalloprotease [Prevotella sp.]
VENWRSVAISRAFLAVPGHYAFAVLMGYYYSLHHFVDHSQRAAILILFMPVLAHGIYDALALSGMVNLYVGSVCFIVLIYFCVKMHKFAQKKVVAHIQRDKEYRTSV